MATKKILKDTKTMKAGPKKGKKTGLEISIIDTKGQEVGKMTLPEDLFNVKASDMLLAQYIRVYLANQRQGTKSTKTRSEVVGSTRKIWRQKGTGRARHGARKASLFVGGGVTFGPKPQDYSLKLNKKQRRKALLYALTKCLHENNMYVVNGLLGLPNKTKQVALVLNMITKNNSKLVVYPHQDSQNLVLGAQNIVGVSLSSIDTLNAYEILKNRTVIFAKEALESFVKPRET